MTGQGPLAIDLSAMKNDAVVADIVYVPLTTPLIAAARRRALRAVGGLGMLLHQAAPGFERWFGAHPVVTEELRALVEADILAVRNIEIIFHTAGSVLPSKDLDLMMSLYADDVVLTDTAHDNKVYQGKEQVRTYWANVSGPFRPEHHWIGYTPAMRIKANVTGNTGTLDFECLWMNVDDNTIGAHAFSSMEVARVKGHWLVKRIKVGKVDKL